MIMLYPQTPHQVASGAVCHGRSRKPAGRPAFRRAADPAGRRFGGRGDLQPHHGAGFFSEDFMQTSLKRYLESSLS